MSIRNCPYCAPLTERSVTSVPLCVYSSRFSRGRSLQPRLAIWMRVGGGTFDDRDELDPARAEFVAEEAVDAPSVLAVGGVHRAQDVELDAVLAQALPTLHHQVEAAFAGAGDAVGVVQLARAVDAQPHQEVVLLQERAPLVVERHAVGLEGLLHLLPGAAVLVDQRHHAAKEVHAHQRRLAALPGHRHLGRAVRFEQLADVRLQRGVRHAVLVVRVERFLRKEEAVLAVDIAGRPARLGEQVKAWRRRHGDTRIEYGREG